MSGRAYCVKMVGMAEVGSPISLVTVYPDCWCICLCYLHFAPENPEDGKMYLLVMAHPGCPGHSPDSHKMVVVVVVVHCMYTFRNLFLGSCYALPPPIADHFWPHTKVCAFCGINNATHGQMQPFYGCERHSIFPSVL